MNELHIDVFGIPAPQGSKSAFVHNGRAVLVESSKKVKPWRAAVAGTVYETAQANNWELTDGPVRVAVTFYLPRPASVTRSHPSVKPDIDKLLRSTLDGLTDSAALFTDDARVVEVTASKAYADARPCGAAITITLL